VHGVKALGLFFGHMNHLHRYYGQIILLQPFKNFPNEAPCDRIGFDN
jgi:hypothetical protein